MNSGTPPALRPPRRPAGRCRPRGWPSGARRRPGAPRSLDGRSGRARSTRTDLACTSRRHASACSTEECSTAECATAVPGPSQPEQATVHRVGPRRGERHLVAAYAERLGDRLPGVVEDQPGVAGGGVQPAWIGVPLVERGEHRVTGRGVQRLGGRGVDVHARKLPVRGNPPGRLRAACGWARVSSVLGVGREGLFRGSAARRALGRTTRRSGTPGERLLRGGQAARDARSGVRAGRARAEPVAGRVDRGARHRRRGVGADLLRRDPLPAALRRRDPGADALQPAARDLLHDRAGRDGDRVLQPHGAAPRTSCSRTTTPPDNIIEVTGQQWSWTFNYGLGDPDNSADDDRYDDNFAYDSYVHDGGTGSYIPELWLPVDETTRFNLHSPDVIHDFGVPVFLMRMDVVPGRVNHYVIKPTRIGVCTGRCYELCGVYHSRMLFKVHVVSREDYEAAPRRTSRTPARPPTSRCSAARRPTRRTGLESGPGGTE